MWANPLARWWCVFVGDGAERAALSCLAWHNAAHYKRMLASVEQVG